MTNLPRKGLSLISLMITLALTSLFFTLSSGYFFLGEKYLVYKTTQQIFELLQWTRSEAIKRNQLTAVCGTTDFKQCSQHWSIGFMAFIIEPSSLNNIQILRIEKNDDRISVKSNQPVIKYSSDGRCFSRTTLKIRGKHTPNQKIVIYDSGRARIASS
ncbi:MAG: GspH/FimT family protein [Proteobacteria bacterium]|nr:GspH/FimT family protein [Pseudomonadota bacterium]